LTGGKFSFPARLRLRKPADYKKVFADPIKSSDKYFTVLACKNDLQTPRMGLAIAKKNIKHAVYRNKIKRAARESFRFNQHTLGNLDFVILARREAAIAPLHILKHSLKRHWLRLVDRCGSYSSQA